jgi:hypothetical protein
MVKYKPGYEHLYKRFPGHYRQLIMNPTKPFRPNYEYLYTPYPPEDDEEKWHHWCEFHGVKLWTDLIFCHNCNKIINPNHHYDGSMVPNLLPARIRYSVPEKILCQSCTAKENYQYYQMEEITKLTREIRNMTRRSKRGKKE